MRIRKEFAIVLLVLNAISTFGQVVSERKVPDVIVPEVRAFDLDELRLLEGPFRRAMEVDHQYLLSIDPERLLHNFRNNAGLPSTTEPLGGWERSECELRGHFVGHYLSACALLYASTGDDRLKEQANAIVSGLAECQSKSGNGYLSAFPESFFDRLEAGQQVWAPYYTIHKILAGLLDVNALCNNRQALDVARKLADWVVVRNARLSEVQMQSVLRTEFGGMSEALAVLYARTGESKYLVIAQRFNHAAVLNPASKGEDRLTGLHANTQIPKFIGAARQYELTGDNRMQSAAQFFWRTVVGERAYVTGGTSDKEYFTAKENLSQALSQNTAESCDVYNMLKLTRQLFCWEPRAEYADYYERALYNSVLASQNPTNGMLCHFIPLKAGSEKRYAVPPGSFSCCAGTGVESQAKYGDSIYFRGADALYVNLFIASELNWKEKGIRLRQETSYPDEQRTLLLFNCDRPVELSLRVRHPWWAVDGMEIRVNGEKQAIKTEQSSYAIVTRTWKTGDKVEVSIPFALRTEGFKDNPKRVAFIYGPLVLCADVDPRNGYAGVVLTNGRLLAGLKPLTGKPNCFTSDPDVLRISGEPTNKTLVFEPFYSIGVGQRYQVYWDDLTPWQAARNQ